MPQQNGRLGVEQLGRADAEVGVNVGPHLAGPAWQVTQPTQAPPFSSSCLKASQGNLASASTFRVTFCGAWLRMAKWRMRPQSRHRLHCCLPSWQLCLCVLFSLGVKSRNRVPLLAGHLVSGPRGCSLGEAARRWRLGRGFVVVAASQIQHHAVLAEMGSPHMASRAPRLIMLWIQPAAQAQRCFCSWRARAPHPVPSPHPSRRAFAARLSAAPRQGERAGGSCEPGLQRSQVARPCARLNMVFGISAWSTSMSVSVDSNLLNTKATLE